MLLQFKETGNIKEMCLQQGGATFHTARLSAYILREIFALRLTSAFGHVT
jgi:hypothetical protein